MATPKPKTIEDVAHDLLWDSKAFSPASLEQVIQIAGDASGRQFYRLTLSGGALNSAILCHQGLSKGRAFGGASTKSQAETFVELSGFLRKWGIAVPQVYHFDQEKELILLEDVGTVGLWQLVLNQASDDGERVKDRLGDDWLTRLFKQAIDVIALYQAIPPDPQSVAFQRYMSFEIYRREIAQFTEFYAQPLGLRPSEASILEAAYDAICETMMSFPKTLAHFDYHAYNLFLSPDDSLRILDFQDACLVTPARDIVSLINDRGMDEQLGRARHSELLSYYYQKLKTSDTFAFQYDTTLLHWEFKVTGQHLRLCTELRTDKYRQWIPGRLRRLGRTLWRSYRSLHGFEDVLEIVTRLSPEAKEGVADPWPLPLSISGGQSSWPRS